MRTKSTLFTLLFMATLCVVAISIAAAAPSAVDAYAASDAHLQADSVLLLASEAPTTTVYLPFVSRPRPPLFVGMFVRWDVVGYGRGSQVWDAGYHMTTNLDAMTDSDTIRSYNYGWYSPNPFGWPPGAWYSYYSVSTLQFIASSAPPNPDWKWGPAYWILPYNVVPSNGATVAIRGQDFLVSGPYAGYTAFGQAVWYWQLTNRDLFLFWDNGGDWKKYVHPGDIDLRYDAGSTRLRLYNNELRHYYYRGSLTTDTEQWIDNLTSTSAWPTSLDAPQGSDLPADESGETQSQAPWPQRDRGGRGMFVAQ